MANRSQLKFSEELQRNDELLARWCLLVSIIIDIAICPEDVPSVYSDILFEISFNCDTHLTRFQMVLLHQLNRETMGLLAFEDINPVSKNRSED
jgi:hypothetical protein